jgi:lipoate-protein ligase A
VQLVNIEQLHIGEYDYDDAIIEATSRDRRPRVQVYQFPETAVVLGRGSKPERELHIDTCLQDEVEVLRRRGGGCAVVIDPGNVIVSAVLPIDGIADNRRYFNRLSEWLAAGLKEIGITDIQHEGISDLACGDQKVSGACIYCSKDLIYYSATLLVESQLELMERYLKHPPREPDYRRGRTHFDFVGRLHISAAFDGTQRLASELRRVLKPSYLLELAGRPELVCT